MNDFSSIRGLGVISSTAFPACHQALPPGRVPHVRGLSRTWVEDDLFPMLSLPVYTDLQEKKKEGPFFTERRTRGPVQCYVAGIRVGMTSGGW
jgi:hypothetical protein